MHALLGGDQPSEASNLEYLGAYVTVDVGGDVWTSALLEPVDTGVNDIAFRPFAEVETLNFILDRTEPFSGDNIVDSVPSIRNKADYFNIVTTNSGHSYPNPELILELEADSPNVDYGFIDETLLTADELTLEAHVAANHEKVIDIPSPEFTDLEDPGHVEIAYPFDLSDGAELEPVVDGSRIISHIRYKLFMGPTVRYPTNSLARSAFGALLNPTAFIISGIVKSPGFEQTTGGVFVTELGGADIDRNPRPHFLGQKGELVGGTVPSGTLNIDSGISEFVLDEYAMPSDEKFETPGDRVFSVTGDLYVSDIGKLRDRAAINSKGVPQPITVFIEGGNLYLEENIEPNPGGPTPDVAFIVFKDKVGEGGNAFVRDNVQSLVGVHMYLDGSLHRYHDDICFYSDVYQGAGLGIDIQGFEPNFIEPNRCSDGGDPGFREPFTTINHQFYFLGSLISNNCINCSVKADPHIGTGQLIEATPYGRSIARLYDLSYLSYFTLLAGTPTGLRNTYVENHVPPLLPANLDFPVYFEYKAPNNVLGY